MLECEWDDEKNEVEPSGQQCHTKDNTDMRGFPKARKGKTMTNFGKLNSNTCVHNLCHLLMDLAHHTRGIHNGGAYGDTFIYV